MKFLTLLLALGAFFAAMIAFSLCTYRVDPTEQIFVTELGRPGGTVNADPKVDETGLHFKKPFVQEINRIEKRILAWDGPTTEMPTRDKLYIAVDNFARWRIVDPKAFYEQLRDERSALSRLDDIIGKLNQSQSQSRGHSPTPAKAPVQVQQPEPKHPS